VKKTANPSLVRSAGAAAQLKRVIRAEDSPGDAIMNRNKIAWLEFIGLALVLLAAGWEVFLSGPLRSVSTENDFYRVEKKLDEIRNQVGVIQDRLGGSDERPGVATSNRELAGGWTWAGKGRETIAMQVRILAGIRGLLFLLGSGFVLWAKYPRAMS